MFINLAPLRHNREYRLLYIGQVVSFLGSMITYVAAPYQIYQITNSSFHVGLLSTVQLLPVIIFGLIGGSIADSMDRRKLLVVSEAGMSIGCLLLALNSYANSPSVWLIYIVCAFMQSLNGFHRPAMEALTQKIVDKKEYGAVAALGSLRSSAGMVIGPAIGGILIATGGAKLAYLVDFISFLIAMTSLWMMRPVPIPQRGSKDSPLSIAALTEGIRYASKRPELMGTYIVDIVAMTFAFPTALFPAMAESWGGAKANGALFSAMSVGSLIVTIFSAWTQKVRRHGAAVVVAAGIWGIGIIGLGLSSNFYMALFCLAIAGGADMISGLFRGTIWNESIPNEMRGRMAGIEMISYMTGPLIGNTRAGWMASATDTHTSVVSGGILCVLGVILCAFLLPRFWRYTSQIHSDIIFK
jgi:MFS family permease